MGDKTQGVYRKYYVQRADGSDKVDKHGDCFHWVLDLDHDPLSIEPMKLYSKLAREAGYDLMADDLDKIIAEADKKN